MSIVGRTSGRHGDCGTYRGMLQRCEHIHLLIRHTYTHDCGSVCYTNFLLMSHQDTFVDTLGEQDDDTSLQGAFTRGIARFSHRGGLQPRVKQSLL